MLKIADQHHQFIYPLGSSGGWHNQVLRLNSHEAKLDAGLFGDPHRLAAPAWISSSSCDQDDLHTASSCASVAPFSGPEEYTLHEAAPENHLKAADGAEWNGQLWTQYLYYESCIGYWQVSRCNLRCNPVSILKALHGIRLLEENSSHSAGTSYLI